METDFFTAGHLWRTRLTARPLHRASCPCWYAVTYLHGGSDGRQSIRRPVTLWNFLRDRGRR